MLNRDRRNQGRGRGLRMGMAGLLALAFAGPAAAQAVLVPTFSGPASYTPGTVVNDGWVLSVRNDGDATATPAITTNFPAGVTVAWTCSATSGSSCAGSGSGNLNRSTDSVAAGGTLTYTFDLTLSSALGADPLSATGTASHGTPAVVSSDGHDATLDRQVDVSVSKTNGGVATYTPGSTSSWTVIVSNDGPSDVSGVRVVDNAPTGMSIQGWACAGSGGGGCGSASGSGNIDQLVDLPDGGSVTYTITGQHPASATQASLTNTATITVPAGATDAATGDDSASASKTRLARTDLAVSFTVVPPPALRYIPGSSGNQIVVRVTNNGPSNSTLDPDFTDATAVGALLSIGVPKEGDPAAALVQDVAWSCSVAARCPAASSGSADDDFAIPLSLASGQSVDVTLSVDYASGLRTPELEWTAAVSTSDTDGTAANDGSDASYAIDRRADLEVEKTSSEALLNPGTAFSYDLTVTNHGPSDAQLLLTDLLDERLDRAPACEALVAGDDALPCWEYCPNAGQTPGTCLNGSDVVETIRGTGSLSAQPLEMAAGDVIVVRIHAAVGNTAAGSSITNTASVTRGEVDVQQPAGTDTTPDSDAVVTPVEVSTDVSVQKTDSATSAVPGQQHSYRVTVRNDGFIAVNNLKVSDALPLYLSAGDAGFVPGSIQWQCRAFEGACCNTNSSSCGTLAPTPAIGADALSLHGVDLPGQSRVEFTFTGMLDERATGTLSNTASLTLPADFADPDPSNNSATDANTVLTPSAALDVEKRLLSLVEAEAGAYTLDYEIVVSNAGPSRVAGAQVQDLLDTGSLDATGATWTCSPAARCAAATGTGNIDTTVDLDVGTQAVFTLQVSTLDNASGEISNTATITHAAGSDSDTVVSGLAGSADLSISKTDGLATAQPGTDVTYTIRVQNLPGGDDVFGATVVDAFPRELEDVSWTCSATTPVPGDLESLGFAGPALIGAGNALALSADGRHAYQVASATGQLIVYDRTNLPGTGFGTVIDIEVETDGVDDGSDPGPAVSGMAAPVDVALSASGTRVFVLSAGALAMFTRDSNAQSPGYGRLSFAGSLTAGVPAAPVALAVTADALYVSSADGIAVFRLDSIGGLPEHDSDQQLEATWSPNRMVVSPAEQLLFVASGGVPYLSSFAIGSGSGATPAGRLTHAASLSDPLHAGATALARAPDQKHLYVGTASGQRLSLVDYTATSLAQRTSYTDTALADVHALAIAPDGEHLYLSARANASLLPFRRNTLDGTLTAEDALARGISGTQPAGQADAVLVTPDGRHLLLASGSDAGQPLQVVSRRAPDPLFALVEVDRNGSDGVQGLLSPTDVAVSPDGEHVYAVSLEDDALAVFRRFPTQGLSADTAGDHLQFLVRYSAATGTAGLDGAKRIRISPDGSRVYVTSELADSLAVFARDAATGTLQPLAVFTDADGTGGPSLSGALGMAVASSHLYVAASFDDAISIFATTAGGLEFLGAVKGGVGGVTGMDGIGDLALSADGSQLLGVSSGSGTVVAFRRETAPDQAPGTLSFIEARALGLEKPVAISMPGAAAGGDPHVYVAAENADAVAVLRRVTDPSSPDFGRVLPTFTYRNGQGGISHMNAPVDLQVSPDGRRVYVAARDSSAVLIFDRDLNQGSANYGGLALVESRRDGVDAVDGLDTVYALAVSNDSRHVYAAGFDDAALASFAVGSGSSCSAGGSGALSDRANLGSGGTVEYVVRGRIRPDATGTLSNTAEVLMPERFDDTDPANNSATDTTALQPQADLALTKTNDQVSVIAGQPVTYEVVVRNPGPSNLVNGPGTQLTLTDLLSADDGFLPDTATWTCDASGSGTLDFVAASIDDTPGLPLLAGASGLALVADTDGGGPLGSYLAATSVLDHAVTLLRRDPLDGRLLPEVALAQGGAVSGLAGARAVVASSDGRFLYVASRISDAVAVLEVGASGGNATLQLRQVEQAGGLLDQAVHLVLSADGAFLYVAAANSSAVTVFARNAADGTLSLVDSEVDGQDDASDTGGPVQGLASVQHLVLSPDGAHLYALSGSSRAIARFDRDPASGELSWRGVLRDTAFGGGASLAGASSAAFDADGGYLYVAATEANRVLVLSRVTTAGGSFGTLSLASSVAQGVDGSLGLLGPRQLRLSADGVHLYVTGQGGSSIAWYLRDPADGGLRYLGQRSAQSSGVQGLGGATGLVLDDALGQVYVAGTLDGALAHFERQADSWCPPSGTGPLVDQPFDIAAGGSITFRITVEVASSLSGNLENTATITADQDPDPSNNTASDIDVHTAVADLAIHKDDGLAEYDGLAGASAIAGDGDHLYVAGSDDNALGIFARVADASAPGGQQVRFAAVLRGGEDGAQGLAGVADVLLSPDGEHVYVASPVDNSVAAYRRDRASGALAFLDMEQNGVLEVTGLSGARALAISPDGRHLYAAGAFSNAIAQFDRNADPVSPGFGQLSFRRMLQNGVGGVLGLGEPLALAVSGDGKHVYALGGESDSVVVFLRNANSGSAGFGELGWLAQYADGSGAITGLAGARSLLLSPSGAHLYVLGAEVGALAHFTRNAGTGQLAFVADLRDGEDGTSGLSGAARMRASADGASLYVAGEGDDAIVHFALAPDGTPSHVGRVANNDALPLGGKVLGLGGARDLLVDAASGHVFSVSAGDAALASFTRSADGSLEYQAVLFDGLGGVAPGDAVRYLIRVDNLGPSATTARVTDNFPEAFSAVSWDCTGASGAACTGSGTGNINQLVSLPVGGHVVFRADGQVGAGATGRLVNTATVAALTAADPNQANNQSTDDDTVLSPAADLEVTVSDGATTSVPGGSIQYDVVIANAGPSYATDVRISDSVPAALREVDWTCSATPIAGVLQPAFPAITAPLDGYRALRITALGRHAYAVGDSGGLGAVALYRRDPLSGELSSQETWTEADGLAGIAGAADLVLSSDERFVYVAGAGADAIALFSRDAESGELAFLAQYQDGDLGIEGLGGVSALALAPDGASLYAAGRLDDAIAVFSVDPSSGALTPRGALSQGQPGMDGLNDVARLAFSADGSHLFAIAGENQSLAAFSRGANGTLTPAGLVQDFELAADAGALLDPAALLVHGSQILVAAAGGDRVSRFAFDPAQGFQLVWSVADGVAGISGLAAPQGLAFDPEQARLYVAGGDALHLFSLLGDTPAQLARYDADGLPLLTGIGGVLLSPNRRQLYGIAADRLSAFDRERGSRCALEGVRGLQGQRVDIAPGGEVHFQLGGRIFANAQGTLDYSVSADTRLEGEELEASDNTASDSNLLTPAPDLAVLKSDGRTEVVAGTAISWRLDLANAGLSDALAAQLVDPAPLFPAATAGLLAGSGQWTCAANPALAAGSLTAAPALAGVAQLAVSPSGTRLYAVNPQTNTLLAYTRATNGALSAPQAYVDGQVLGEATVQGLGGASSVAVTPDGRHVLVTGSTGHSLAVFEVEPGGLAWQQALRSGQDGVAGLQGAAHVVVSADGAWVFVAGAASHAIGVFRRDTATGQLAFVERVADGLGTILPDSNVLRGVRRLHVTGDGRFLYALAAQSQAVSSFAVHPDTGRLSYLGRLRQGDAGVVGLTGARDLAAAPGGGSVYVLGDSVLNLFTPDGEGRLTVATRYDAIPQLGQGRALALDASGSRLYLADDAGAVHVFARDWSNGLLDLRHRHQDALAPVPATALLSTVGADLYVAAAVPGRIERLGEQALSRCLAGTGTSDAPVVNLDVGVGGWGQVDFHATVHPSARGVLTNVATFLPSDGTDPATADNTASDNTSIRVVSDVAISKSGPATAVAGTSVEYRIAVSNAGPSSALGLRVQDGLHAALQDASWTCSASAGSSCAASGSGALDLPVQLLPGGTLEVVLVAQVAPGFLGVLPNTASLVMEPGATDPTPGDHADGSSVEVHAEVDLSLDKSNGGDGVTAGATTSYSIVVANAGPSDAVEVAVADLLPAVLQDATWTCQANGSGSACPAAGSGDIAADVAVGAGGDVRFTLLARVDAAAEGMLVNTATATLLGSAVELAPGDESDTDTDAISLETGLSVTLLAEVDPFDPASALPLPITALVANAGPSLARAADLVLAFSAPVVATVPAGCSMQGPSTVRCTLAAIDAGATLPLAFALRNLPAAPGTFSVLATVTARDHDPNAGNDLAARDILLQTGGDIRVAIDNDAQRLIPGREVTYVVDVANLGSTAIAAVDVDVPLAAGLLAASWTCSGSNGAACAGSGSGAIADTIALASGQAVRYRLTAVLDPDLDPSVPTVVAQGVTATVPAGSDMNLANNSAVDEDLVFFIVFGDGFEAALLPAGKSGSDRLQPRECAVLALPGGACPASDGTGDH